MGEEGSILPGLPNKFKGFRANQWDMIEAIVEGRGFAHLVVNAATGSGKSLSYVAAHILSGSRMCVLTKTKALQDQLMADFAGVAAVIKGRNEYPCSWDVGLTADQGPCVAGVKCALTCEYKNAVEEAKQAALVITNYSYWIAKNRYGDGLGKFAVLVCDESHLLPGVISDAMTLEVNTAVRSWREVMGARGAVFNTEDISEWAAMAEREYERVHTQWLSAKKDIQKIPPGGEVPRELIRQFHMLNAVNGKLQEIAEMTVEDWVVEAVGSEKYQFSPIVIAGRVPSLLQYQIPRVVFTSATVTQRTMRVLGVTGYGYIEYPHTFPLENRRLIHIPTVRVNHRMGDVDRRLWLARIDQIIDSRPGLKGIIHTVSYARAREIMTTSRFRMDMVLHDAGETQKAIVEFKRRTGRVLLVSPVVGEGYDFPDDACRYQIITKIPYPDTRGAVMKARISQDKGYPSYIAMQNLIQMVGRGTRSETDWSDSFIVDDSVGWFLKQYGDCAPGWFREAYVRMDAIPKVRKEE
jgi:ATP-dependent DNA helicase DinG